MLLFFFLSRGAVHGECFSFMPLCSGVLSRTLGFNNFFMKSTMLYWLLAA